MDFTPADDLSFEGPPRVRFCTTAESWTNVDQPLDMALRFGLASINGLVTALESPPLEFEERIHASTEDMLDKVLISSAKVTSFQW